MAAREAVKSAVRQVRPILSVDRAEARKRVLNLYKAWYRQLPYVVKDYDIPKTVAQCRTKLREEFDKNRHVTDIRVIDMLVIKPTIKYCAALLSAVDFIQPIPASRDAGKFYSAFRRQLRLTTAKQDSRKRR